MKFSDAQKVIPGSKLNGIAAVNVIRIKHVIGFKFGTFSGSWELIVRDICNNIWKFNQFDTDVFVSGF